MVVVAFIVVFPSPLGDYFFNLNYWLTLISYLKVKKFPSPLGDYFFNRSID